MVCKNCHKNKKKEDFYIYVKNKCKKCYIRHSLDHRNKEKRSEYQKKYYQVWYKNNGRNRGIDYIEAIEEWKRNHPEAAKAHQLVHRALLSGKIKKPKDCMYCNKEKRVSGHHLDYSKPLEVLWLCSSCHKLEHLKRT